MSCTTAALSPDVVDLDTILGHLMVEFELRIFHKPCATYWVVLHRLRKDEVHVWVEMMMPKLRWKSLGIKKKRNARRRERIQMAFCSNRVELSGCTRSCNITMHTCPLTYQCHGFLSARKWHRICWQTLKISQHSLQSLTQRSDAAPFNTAVLLPA